MSARGPKEVTTKEDRQEVRRRQAERRRKRSRQPKGPTKLSDIGREIRKMPEHGQWKRQVLRDAAGQCRLCGDTESPLQVDHIRPVADLIRERGVQGPQDAHKAPELFDPGNGQALCKPCHRRKTRHQSRYGVSR